MLSADIVAIVNPLSGAGANPRAAARRLSLLEARFAAAGRHGRVHLTEAPGHARALAQAAIDAGAPLVIAWGGDGTINEIAGVLTGTPTALGIVAAGSGNGFAAEVGVPREPAAAIDVALYGRDTAIDVGELNGRCFFNIAGIGVDAAIARRFNARPMGRRGLGPYVRLALAEAFRYRAADYRIILDGAAFASRALLIAFANGREYGNGLRLAPHARLDDGKLEAMVVEDRPPLARIWHGRHLALGTAHRAAGVIARSIVSATIQSEGSMPFHVDGEPGIARDEVKIALREGALLVRVAP